MFYICTEEDFIKEILYDFAIMRFLQQLPFFNRQPPIGRGMGNGLLINGILCIVFGIAILAAPELLAYIVSTFLIIVGISLIAASKKIRGLFR